MKTNIDFTHTHFVKSVLDASQLPKGPEREIAFVGRSNAGKSSVLNLLCQQKDLARISKTPGRTQALNFFAVNTKLFLVDLPGYGYAKVQRELQAQWEKLLTDYILTRAQLAGIVVIMDARHPFTDLDIALLELAQQRLCPCHVLLNKVDKLTQNERNRTWQNVQNKLMISNMDLSVQFFSVLDAVGLPELKGVIAKWLQK